MKSHPLAWIAAAVIALPLAANEPAPADTPSSSLDRRQQRALEAAQKRRDAETAKAPVVAEPTKVTAEKARSTKKKAKRKAAKQS